jgi:hypothetical protein
MTDSHTTGENLEQLLERIIFEDPATHRLRDEWEESKRTEQAVFERVCHEEYERRLKDQQIGQTLNPEETARRETNLCAILFREEREGRLWVIWQDILRRVRAVLADKKVAESEGS